MLSINNSHVWINYSVFRWKIDYIYYLDYFDYLVHCVVC